MASAECYGCTAGNRKIPNWKTQRYCGWNEALCLMVACVRNWRNKVGCRCRQSLCCWQMDAGGADALPTIAYYATRKQRRVHPPSFAGIRRANGRAARGSKTTAICYIIARPASAYSAFTWKNFCNFNRNQTAKVLRSTNTRGPTMYYACGTRVTRLAAGWAILSAGDSLPMLLWWPDWFLAAVARKGGGFLPRIKCDSTHDLS